MLQNSLQDCQHDFQTPSSNTGFNSQDLPDRHQIYEPWVDFYQGTARMQYQTLRYFVNYYQKIFFEELTPLWGHGRYIGNRTYQYKLQSPLGTQLYWVEDIRNECPDVGEYLQSSADISIDEQGELSTDAIVSASTWVYVHLSISGKPLNHIGVFKQLEFIYEATTEFGFSVTRIDTKVRDYSGRINISEIISIAAKGDFSGSKNYSTYTSRYIGDGVSTDNDSVNVEPTKCSGETLYFGSPASDKRTTFYNAKYVHKVDAIDIEVRWRNDRAKACLASILFQESGERLPYQESIRVIHRIVAGSINFVHRGNDKNINRLPVYDFWRDFGAASDGVLKVSAPKRGISGYRMVEWLSKQVAPTLAMLKKIVGIRVFMDFIESLVKQGSERLTDSQRAYVQLCMQTRDELKRSMFANQSD